MCRFPLSTSGFIPSLPCTQDRQPALSATRPVCLTVPIPFARNRSSIAVKMDALVDIITVENLHQKMPQWDPANSNHLYALVDMGR